MKREGVKHIMMASRSFTKEFHNLLKNIHSMSGGQARVSDWDDEDLSRCEVEVSPTGGLYKYAKFKFQVSPGSTRDNDKDHMIFVGHKHGMHMVYVFELCMNSCPEIICKTPIYHPNIDTVFESSDGTNVCVSVLDEWNEDNCLDDCIQGLLFLFYNPNLEDPLCPIISPDTTKEEFEDNVNISLKGGDVEGLPFETNYGYLENGIVKNRINEKGFGGNIATSQEVVIRNNEKMNIETNHEVNIELSHEVNIETSHEVNIELSHKVNIETCHEVNIETTELVDDIKITEEATDKSSEQPFIGTIEKANISETIEKTDAIKVSETTNENNAEEV